MIIEDILDQHVQLFTQCVNERFLTVTDLQVRVTDDAITRAENYVKANELFTSLSDKDMYELVDDLGLLPLIFLLPGVDEIHTQLLNGFDFSGYVRYIDTALTDLTNIHTLAEFYEDILSHSETKTKNNVVIYLLDLFINSPDTEYRDVLANYYQLTEDV